MVINFSRSFAFVVGRSKALTKGRRDIFSIGFVYTSPEGRARRVFGASWRIGRPVA